MFSKSVGDSLYDRLHLFVCSCSIQQTVQSPDLVTHPVTLAQEVVLMRDWRYKTVSRLAYYEDISTTNPWTSLTVQPWNKAKILPSRQQAGLNSSCAVYKLFFLNF